MGLKGLRKLVVAEMKKHTEGQSKRELKDLFAAKLASCRKVRVDGKTGNVSLA